MDEYAMDEIISWNSILTYSDDILSNQQLRAWICHNHTGEFQ